MATVTAAAVATTDSLETFRQQFNTLRSDISGLSFDSSIVFEGATANDFETTLTVTDPTADRTITFPDKTDTIALLGDLGDVILLNGTDSSSTDAGDNLVLNATSGAGADDGDQILFESATGDHLENPAVRNEVDVLLETATFNKKDFLLDERDSDHIEFESATNDVLLGALFIPPASGGVQYTLPAADGSEDQVLATDGSGNLSFKNQASGMSLANDGNNRVVTGTGSGSGNGEANLTFDGSTLTVTGNITVPNDGDIGSVGSTSAIQISSGGIVTFVDDIKIKDGGTIGSASDADAISISSGGVVNISATTANTSASDGALTVAGGVGIALDASVGDDLRLISDGAILSFGADSDITVTHVADTGIQLGDSMKMLFGASADLEIFHDGSDSHIKDTGTGDLYISASDDLVLRTKEGAETALIANDDGSVDIYYDNSKKFETTSTGIQITSTTYAPITRRGEDVFIVLDGTNAAGANAGDNVIMDASAASTDVGDDIIGEDEVFLHSGMQRNVIEIRDSGGGLLNSVAGFAPGAI